MYETILLKTLTEFFDNKPYTVSVDVVPLGKMTSDYNNTDLAIGIVGYEFGGEDGDYYEDQEKVIKELTEFLGNKFNSIGDHHEEVKIGTGNHDIYIMLSANK